MMQLLALVVTLTTPSFRIAVDLPSTTLVSEQSVDVAIDARGHRGRAPAHVAVIAVPGLDVDASRFSVPLRRAADGHFAGTLSLPVRGPWYLEVDAGDPPERAAVPLTVSAPGALAPWAAWAIACVPLALFGAFAWSERRRISRVAGAPDARSLLTRA